MHWPPEQVPLHATLHPPQFVLLDCVSTQFPPHAIWPEGQAQLPPVQVDPTGHAWPHDPQFATLEVVSTHAPAEHCIWPVGQPDDEHAPLAQTWVPVQAFPHIPQLLASC
jgi:hypothetical protein